MKFVIGSNLISIDISKEYQNRAIGIYRLLSALCLCQQENLRLLSFTKNLSNVHIHLPENADPVTTLNASLSNWVESAVGKYDPVSYKGIFEKFATEL